MSTVPLQYRQGDILLEQVDSIPNGVRRIEGKVVRLGEKTGHAHTFAETDQIVLYGTDMPEWVVVEEEAELTHPEHATIPVPAGNWQIIQQKEYVPEVAKRSRPALD